MSDTHHSLLASAHKKRSGSYRFPFEYKNSAGQYFGTIILYSAGGLFLGILLDKITKYLQDNFGISRLVAVIVQFLLFVTVLYILENTIFHRFSSRLHISSPGIFFLTFAFVSQFRMFINLALITGVVPSEVEAE